MNSNDVVEIWTVNYVKSIFLLSNRYDSIKPLLIKNNDDKKFTIKALGIYKTIGCFDINVFRKYSGYYRMCGHSYLNIIIVYLIPTLVFKILFKIISIMKGLWKEKL